MKHTHYQFYPLFTMKTLRILYFLLGFMCGATAVLLALIILAYVAGW